MKEPGEESSKELKQEQMLAKIPAEFAIKYTKVTNDSILLFLFFNLAASSCGNCDTFYSRFFVERTQMSDIRSASVTVKDLFENDEKNEEHCLVNIPVTVSNDMKIERSFRFVSAETFCVQITSL